MSRSDGGFESSNMQIPKGMQIPRAGLYQQSISSEPHWPVLHSDLQQL